MKIEDFTLPGNAGGCGPQARGAVSIEQQRGAEAEGPPAGSSREGALSPPRAVHAALLSLPLVGVKLAFPIGQPPVAPRCILRQPIVKLVALAIRHPSITVLC